MWGIRSPGEYKSLMKELSPGYKNLKLPPECARNLVEGAVEYARHLGFEPHPDYRQAKLIFGDTDGMACTEKFEYGRNGKPMFIAGPHDGPNRCRNIVNTLKSRLGENGFHFMMPIHPTDIDLDDWELIDEDLDWNE